MNSGVNGKTQAELERDGYYVGNFTPDVKDSSGHSTGTVIDPYSGKAVPKPQG